MSVTIRSRTTEALELRIECTAPGELTAEQVQDLTDLLTMHGQSLASAVETMATESPGSCALPSGGVTVSGA